MHTLADCVSEFIAEQADRTAHYVCHCTNYNTSACGSDRSGLDWAPDDAPGCPLCNEAWPYEAALCPWGCPCDEECGAGGEGVR